MPAIAQRRHVDGRTYQINEHPPGVFTVESQPYAPATQFSPTFQTAELAMKDADARAAKRHNCAKSGCDDWARFNG
jgi:hypothetical protein